MYLRAYAATLAVLVVIDSIWLGLLARNFYASQLGDRLSANPDLVAAAVFYLVFAGGIVYLAVRPAIAARAARVAAQHGAALGVTAYSTYELTNLATLDDWPLVVVMVDVVWGAAIACASSLVGFAAARSGRGPPVD